MRLVTQLESNKHHIDIWLSLWQGGTGITTREKDVLSEFIAIYMMLKSQDIKEPYLSKILFDSDSRKSVCDTLKISSFNLTNILASLRTKGCIFEDKISPQLIPQKELIFVFE